MICEGHQRSAAARPPNMLEPHRRRPRLPARCSTSVRVAGRRSSKRSPDGSNPSARSQPATGSKSTAAHRAATCSARRVASAACEELSEWVLVAERWSTPTGRAPPTWPAARWHRLTNGVRCKAESWETTRPPVVVNRPRCTSDPSVLDRIRGSRPSQADRHRRPDATTDSPDYNHDHKYDQSKRRSSTTTISLGQSNTPDSCMQISPQP